MTYSSALSGRRCRATAFHLLLSLIIGGMVAMLVFGFWFPRLLRELVGGVELFWLVVGVDVVCGPLLTLVVFNPVKPTNELRRDVTVVAIIQLLVLVYGIHTLGYARPVAIGHEVDRFRVVSFADMDVADAHTAPSWAMPWSLSGPRAVGIRTASNATEVLASVDASLQGIEPSQRPSWWQDYALSVPQVLAKAKPMSELRAKHPGQAALLETAASQAIAGPAAKETTDPAALRWLPMVSRRAADWVALIDPTTARVRGAVHLDGF
ncbi:MAG: hypothetical protein EOO23_06495 [Comamonadaceae bacterium]|nr:MAG: hypothetical protein EOO23_06495 [Comamonadaceae bacterium]